MAKRITQGGLTKLQLEIKIRVFAHFLSYISDETLSELTLDSQGD
jgi:hypothetical protein